MTLKRCHKRKGENVCVTKDNMCVKNNFNFPITI